MMFSLSLLHITHFYVSLVVLVGQISGLTTLTSYNLTLFSVFSWVTVSAIKLISVSMFQLGEFIFHVM
jgi:hypothetical protein